MSEISEEIQEVGSEIKEVILTKDTRHKIYAGVGYTIYKAAEEAYKIILSHNNPPSIFIRGNRLVQSIMDAKTGVAIIRIITEDILSGEINNLVKFYSTTSDKKGNKKDIELKPPREVIKYILLNCDWKGTPVLDGVTSCPIITLDGKIQIEGGYNKDLQMIYVPTKPLNIKVSNNPTKKEVDESIETLEDILVDFPFIDQPDKSNMMGLMISTVLKPALIDEMYPLVIITKPVQGAGASKLSKIIGIIKNGEEPKMEAMPDEAEVEKRLTVSSIRGEDLIIYDNFTGPFYSSEVAHQITQKIRSGRVLGKSIGIEYPFTPIWIVNGINVTTAGDMTRRSIPIRLDPKEERPWLHEDADFTHPDIIRYIKEKRENLISALFTIIRYWVQNGKNLPDKNVPSLGDFEMWRSVIGGALSNTKYGSTFLTNVKTMYEECDTSGDQWIEFLTEWHINWRWGRVRTSQIVKTCENKGLHIGYSLPGEIANAKAKGKDLSMSIGRALSGIKNRIYTITIDGDKATHRTPMVKLTSRISAGVVEYFLVEVDGKTKKNIEQKEEKEEEKSPISNDEIKPGWFDQDSKV